MSNGTPLLRFIKGMTLAELNAIRRRCEWCNVRDYDNKSDLAIRIRDSINRSVENGDLTYSEAMQDIRLQVLIPGPATVETTVRQALREAPIADPTGDIRLIEEWFSAQLYGHLSAKVHDPYEVYLGYEVNHRNRHQADIYLHNTDGGEDILIEVRRDGEIRNGKQVKREIQKSRRHIDGRPDLDHQKTFLCIVTEKYIPEEKGQPSEFLDIPSTVDEIESEIDDLEVVISSIE